MNKTVEKIVVSPEGIDIISNVKGVNNVTQISLEPQGDEIKEILEKYNLSDLKFYPLDMNIVRALSESQEQLVDYLETTRRLSNTKQKMEVPEDMPQVIYDLRELKNSFEQVDDESLRKLKQMGMYNQAKHTQAIFKGTKKVDLKMGPIDRGYFAVQALLQSKNRITEIKALNPGIIEQTRDLRRELYNPEYTEKTNEAAKAFVENSKEQANEEKQVEEELIQESEEIIAR